MVGVIVAVSAGVSVVDGVSVMACACVGVALGKIGGVGVSPTVLGTSLGETRVGKSVGASPGVGVINGGSEGSGVSEITATVVASEVGAGWLQAASSNSTNVISSNRILCGVCIGIPSTDFI